MEFLSLVFLNNSLERWLLGLGVTFLSYLFFTVLRRTLVKRLRLHAWKTLTHWDDAVLVVLLHTKHFFLFFSSVYLGTHFLHFSPRVDAFLTRLSFLALLFQVALWGTSLIRFFIERDVKVSAATDGARAQTMKAIGFIATFALYLVILLWGLDNFGVNITTLIAGLGVGGIAIALAVQNILGDLFASLTIVLDKPFVYGDFITVGEFKGTIENVGLKTTRVRSLTGEQLIFPNSDLLQSRIRNFKRMQERRAAFVFNVDNNTPVEELKRLLQELRRIVENQKAIRFERANFTQFTATNALEFEVIYWVLSPDYQIYANVQEAINLEILAYLQSQKIRFPFAPAPSPVKS